MSENAFHATFVAVQKVAGPVAPCSRTFAVFDVPPLVSKVIRIEHRLAGHERLIEVMAQ